MNRLTLVLLVAVTLAAPSALAGGFLIYEHGATATGMAEARTALADDVNALYFNPAAITELAGLQLEVGLTGILPYVSYQAAGRTDNPRTYNRFDGTVVEVNDGLHDTNAKLVGFTPIHLYAAYRIPGTGVSVGFGLNNPFGLGTYWPADWDGKYITTESEMTTFFNQPVVAVDIAALAGFKDRLKLSLAAGYNFVYATARIVQKFDLRMLEPLSPIVGPEGEMRLTGEALGHGWNLALYAEIPGLLAFGASARSGISLPLSGTARFFLNSAALQAQAANLIYIPEQTTGKVTIDLPYNLNFGLAYLGVKGLKVALDLYLAFFQSYDELDIHFSCLDEVPACGNLKQDPIRYDWGTAWQLSLGAEYLVAEFLALRAGYGSSFSPVPDRTVEPSLPDGRQDMFCLGLGYRGGSFKVDLGYMLAMWDREKNNDMGGEIGNNPNGKANGLYSTVAHLLALSLSMGF